MIKGIKAVLRYVNSRADRIDSMVALVKMGEGYEVHWNRECEVPTVFAHACMFVHTIAEALDRSPDNVIALISRGIHECLLEVEEEVEADDGEIDSLAGE